jgi:hypothetical protein
MSTMAMMVERKIVIGDQRVIMDLDFRVGLAT